MSMGAWTWLAIAVLIVIPAVTFVLFLKDATALFRALHARPEDPSASAPPPGSGDA